MWFNEHTGLCSTIRDYIFFLSTQETFSEMDHKIEQNTTKIQKYKKYYMNTET